MPKTRDAFALRGFDEKRILQRPFFKEFDLPVADDDKIGEDFFDDVADDINLANGKLKLAERLNDCAKKYLLHLETHKTRLRKIMRVYADKYISSHDEKIVVKNQRAINLLACYFDLYQVIEQLLLGNVTSHLLNVSYLLLLRLYRSKFSSRLRQARKAANLTQQQLAERVGLKTYNAIAQYERGINDPSLLTVFRITQELKCSANWLIGLQ